MERKKKITYIWLVKEWRESSQWRKKKVLIVCSLFVIIVIILVCVMIIVIIVLQYFYFTICQWITFFFYFSSFFLSLIMFSLGCFRKKGWINKLIIVYSLRDVILKSLRWYANEMRALYVHGLFGVWVACLGTTLFWYIFQCHYR